MMRIIQKTKSFPEDWLQQVENFNVEESELSTNNKVIAKILVPHIKSEEDSALLNPLNVALISDIVLNTNLLSSYYDDLPHSLIQNGLDELRGQRGFQFTQKLDSIFIEFITFINLQKEGYTWVEHEREEGSCDLLMTKNNQFYHFEVKFKESNDTLKSRLYDCIDGMSLLEKYRHFRGKTYNIRIKTDTINDRARNEILAEVQKFIEALNDSYEGAHIKIFNTKKPNNNFDDVVDRLNDCLIQKGLTNSNDIDGLVQKIFMTNGHITKLEIKSKKTGYNTNNFYGVLVWNIPFTEEIDGSKIEQAFKNLALDFNLYVFIGGGVKQESYNFLLKP